MKNRGNTIGILILIAVLSGCKTTQKIQPVQEIKETVAQPSGELINYIGLDLTSLASEEKSLSLAELKTLMKKRVREMVQKEESDGLYLKISGQTPDLPGELLAEAMLIKPYLVTSVAWSDETGHQAALRCLEERSADFIIPVQDVQNANRNGLFERFKMTRYPKKVQPGQVVELDLSALFPGNQGGQKVNINNSSRTTDSEGKTGFIINKTDSIALATPAGSMVLRTADWFLPYRYAVLADGKVARKSPWVEFRMMPDFKTGSPDYDFLCKTDYPASVRINGDSVKQYKTGIFFKKVAFNEGSNRIRTTVLTPDSLTAMYECEFVYEKTDRTRERYPLWIDRRSVEPSFDLELLPEDNVRVTFRGSLGQDGIVELRPGKFSLKCLREDFSDYSIYSVEFPLRDIPGGKAYTMTFRLIPVAGAPVKSQYLSEVQRVLTVRQPEDFPLVKVKNEYSRLTYDLGAPRLGGPIRQELAPGVILKTSGKFGDNYRIRLSGTENGYINKDDVEVMPAGSIQRSYYVTSMLCGPAAGADVLTIPWPEPVPYEVYPDPEQKRLVITLFGAETASTWVTHRTGLKVIEKVTWDQTTPETYRIYVNLKDKDIWGYEIRPSGRSLILRVKYPPAYDPGNEKPLSGLKIAIEAGHGGSNSGAIGLSGLVEKDINLDLSFRLGELLRSMGAEVIQVRDSDKDMLLLDKRSIAISSGANILISIHANAGGRGYLSTGGTSTYWHNPFWAPLSQAIYDRLLETGLAEFGVVGSFNYTVTRVTQMPSILVEQAFMTNAEDEEKLADPLFRQLEAEKICEGIIDYLKYMKR